MHLIHLCQHINKTGKGAKNSLFFLEVWHQLINFTVSNKLIVTNYTLPETSIETYPPHAGNAITKEYYNFLIGEINRGTIKKAVCRVEDKRFFNCVSYYLISTR
jgi:hypothetical protein